MKDRGMEKRECTRLSVTTVARRSKGGLFIDLAGRPRKEIMRLKGGAGTLTREIELAIERWREELGVGAATEVVPVVLLYQDCEPDYIVVNWSWGLRSEDGC